MRFINENDTHSADLAADFATLVRAAAQAVYQLLITTGIRSIHTSQSRMPTVLLYGWISNLKAPFYTSLPI